MLIIRTQDKRDLVDMTGMIIDIAFEGIGSKSEIRVISNQTGNKYWKPLGRYSTEEKAMKVLDMIQAAYEKVDINRGYHGGYVINTVFEMPSDEEVNV